MSAPWFRRLLCVSLVLVARAAADAVLPAHLVRLDLTNDVTALQPAPGEWHLSSRRITVPARWNELIVSWNAATNVSLTLEARGWFGQRPTRWYPLGEWSAHGPRTSAPANRDDDGEVQTDVLVLQQPADAAEVRVRLRGERAALQLVTLAFCNSRLTPPPRPPHTAAWGRLLDVPVRSQADFPEGVTKWCSPTSTSMLLEFWARQLRRPDLDLTVPATAAAVFDPGWGGTGNWPFNTAFAGAQPGLRACVSRANDLADLEQWLAAGLPAAASVSYTLLKGGAKAEAGDGHIVVVRGFSKEGDVAINDPGVRRSRGQRVIPRADFVRAWDYSKRTCYLVWPEAQPTPAGPCFP